MPWGPRPTTTSCSRARWPRTSRSRGPKPRQRTWKRLRGPQAHDFIAGLPDGYDTVVGDRGVGLSGGQRQRVALARALLAEPVVLLLDNATGNLDALTEAAVLDGLDARWVDAPPTRIVVGYRPAVLRRADEIVLLDRGRVVERGTHEGLLRSSARYRELVGVEAEGEPRKSAP